MGSPAACMLLARTGPSVRFPHLPSSAATDCTAAASLRWRMPLDCSLIRSEDHLLKLSVTGLSRREKFGSSSCSNLSVRALQKNAISTEDDSSLMSSVAGKVPEHEVELKSQRLGSDESSADHSGTASEEALPKRIQFDYGFQARFLRTGPTVPQNVFKLAFENFGREWRALRRSYLFRVLKPIRPAEIEGGPFQLVGAYTGRGLILFLRGLDKFLTLYDGLKEIQPVKQQPNIEQDELREQLKKLKLSNKKVWEREKAREQVEAPWWILGPYYFLCWMLDVIFEDRPIQRFWFLETVARMPYFSYISMLHLYETLGWWRSGAEVRKVHFAEEWNEMHHLKIMESLGGDLEWGDRFFAQHAAFFYYWTLNAMFLISPTVAYNFSELIESHAVDTYGEFADENEELLKTLPPSPVAVAYYESGDLYMYDEFQTSRPPESRRPKMGSLYDVFMAICGDEGEHVKTMVACQQLDTQVVSPNRVKYSGQKVETEVEIPDRLP
ncbi:ubiquinol oxidase [Marchantia polymorpha subsp. ruderalis]|uniref:Ubiquinol oxidase n=2 Tax=Marchantia polymorpha TaxID=3197 RepID=A0AAF6BYE9_MARPO|nr:hypothetical protein MARPO_0003s0157 [Marchantia polymorpha]BBN17033.1 hypothetical protein Mp_7g11430 [Marchantia polymorpha subsp. ruderalis]|eukprot:PTQ49270.1 hypothetical protein MARPO_0003s0157 [Marchantia polymorpha]